MAYQKKLEFNLPAVIYTVLATTELMEIFSKEFSTSREELKIIAENPSSMNGKASLKMRHILRNNIEKKVATRNFYIDKMFELKQKENPITDKERQSQEFSLQIVGSGTKSQISENLRNLANVIELTLLEELRDGIELESACTVLTTDLPEAYEGEV